MWRRSPSLGPASPTCTTLHVDLVGLLPASRDGSIYLLTMIDRCTRWPEMVPLGRIDFDTVLEAFMVHHHVGGPLWRTSPHHHRQGDPVHLWYVGRLVSEAGGPAHHHHGLPAPGQWHGGADLPHAEGGPLLPRGGRCLEGTLALVFVQFVTLEGKFVFILGH